MIEKDMIEGDTDASPRRKHGQAVYDVVLAYIRETKPTWVFNVADESLINLAARASYDLLVTKKEG